MKKNFMPIPSASTTLWFRHESDSSVVAAIWTEARNKRLLATKSYQAHILRNGLDLNCRFCTHILRVCCSYNILLLYQMNFKMVGQCLYLKIWQHYNLPHTEKWYDQKIAQVQESVVVTLVYYRTSSYTPNAQNNLKIRFYHEFTKN